MKPYCLDKYSITYISTIVADSNIDTNNYVCKKSLDLDNDSLKSNDLLFNLIKTENDGGLKENLNLVANLRVHQWVIVVDTNFDASMTYYA